MNRFLLLPLLALAGCAANDTFSPNFGSALSPDFGNAVASNIAAQVDNPAPNTNPRDHMSDGKRSSDAMERYRTGHVYPPIPAIQAEVKQGSAPDQPPPVVPSGQ